MTPEQWKKIETQLTSPWGNVNLRVDGYDVTFQVQQIKPLRFVITVFVDGYSRAPWLLRSEAGEWCDEARRFLPLKKRCLYNTAQLKRAGKMAKEFSRQVFEFRNFYWTSFTALKRHLIANNQSIELSEEKHA